MTKEEIQSIPQNTPALLHISAVSVIRRGFPGGTVVRNPPADARDARDTGLAPQLARAPGQENDSPLQYSCLENSMDRGARWATGHGVTKSQI